MSARCCAKTKSRWAAKKAPGMTIRGHLPEKDGILACLLVAEMIAARQTSLGDQLRDLFSRVGANSGRCVKICISPRRPRPSCPSACSKDFKEFAGHKVAKTDRTDGLQADFRRRLVDSDASFGHRAGRAHLH